MDRNSQFEQEAEKFIGATRQEHEDVLKKLYAKIPIAADDPDYTKKINNYLEKIGFKGIIKLLGYDNLKIAALVMEGLGATKYNRYEDSREADLKTRLTYINFAERKIKEEKQNALTQNNYTYVPPTWFHAGKIIENSKRMDQAQLEQLNSVRTLAISACDNVKVAEDN